MIIRSRPQVAGVQNVDAVRNEVPPPPTITETASPLVESSSARFF